MKMSILGPFGYLSQQPDGSIQSRPSVGAWETFDAEEIGPPPPPPLNPGADQIDMSQAIITAGSPDVRGWSKTATMHSLSLSSSQNMAVGFDKQLGPDAWPQFVPTGFADPLQWTLWVGCYINARWYLAGVILCLTDVYCPTGPALAPQQLPANWYYFTSEPLASYDPAPGEQVAFFTTSGVQRRDDQHIITERSNVVIVPFRAGTFTW